MAANFQKKCQEGFNGPWAQWKNYSWPEGRKHLDDPDLRDSSKEIIIGKNFYRIILIAVVSMFLSGRVL
jgi:hypothetical protein